MQIYSEPGLGTTFSVLLPATGEEAVPHPAAVNPCDDCRGHGETILLVEDEESLRAADEPHPGPQRLPRLSRPPAAPTRCSGPAIRLRMIDLLLTDVIMPEMLGNEVAAGVRAIHPHLPCLFMSGYAGPILDSHAAGAPGADILEKPFTETGLLTRVRRAISQARAEQH